MVMRLISPMGRFQERILASLTEPRTANEVAKIVGCNQHTAQKELLELATKGEAKHKKIGRSHVFW